jgi:hypothetical protein
VKIEINSRLAACRNRLDDLGPERTNSAEQMAYLAKLATKFQRLVSLAIGATHGADGAFESNPALRIAPAAVARMKAFEDDMGNFGHTYSFMAEHIIGSSAAPLTFVEDDEQELSEQVFGVRQEGDPEDLLDVLHPQEYLSYPHSGAIKSWLVEVFQGNRGFELGTFNASILATAMKKQCSKWTPISMGFVSDIIVMVHSFIHSALAAVCSDRNVCDTLINKLSDELIRRYQKALAHTRFLLEVENGDTPMTLNHYFNENLQKR